MRRDRDGSELPDDEDQDLDVEQLAHASRCRDGWLGQDPDRPAPCPICRPHLARYRRRTRAQIFGPWAA